MAAGNINKCFGLVFSPHPDDAELGMGGTVAKWTAENKEVVYVVCTSGDKGTDDPNIKPNKLARIREDEQKAAASLLGVKKILFLRHKDLTLQDSPAFLKEIVELIRIYRPEIVATTDPQFPRIWHRDHRATGQVVMDAVYPLARNRPAYPDMLKKGLEPHKVKILLLWNTCQPNSTYDITGTYSQKLLALQHHISQFGPVTPEWETNLKAVYLNMGIEQDSGPVEVFRKIDIYW